MPFTTPTQFAALALCILAGWLFGFASAPGGRRYRNELRDAEVEHARAREEHDRARREHGDALRAAERARDEAIRERDAAIAERDAARSSAPVVAPAVAGAAVGAAAATAAEGGSGWRGWFGWGRDNLSRIAGIDQARETRLNELGIKTYR